MSETAIVAAAERLLSILAWVARAESPAELAEAIERGSPAAVLQQLPEEIRRQAAVDLGFLGERGLGIVAAVLADATSSPSPLPELLTDLGLLLRQGALRLDRQHLASRSNVEQLAQALVKDNARWRDLADGGLSALEQWVERALTSCARLLEIRPESPARRRNPPAAPVVVAEAAREGIETDCAGVFLLLRAILDAHLPAIVHKAAYPPGAEPSPLGAVLTALGWCWGGESAVAHGGLDPGLALLAGWNVAPTLEEIRGSWRQATVEDHLRFQTALLRVLAGQRLVCGSVLHLHQVARGDRVALVAGADGGGLWPLGQVFPSREALRSGLDDLLAQWLEIWQETLGRAPEIVLCDSGLVGPASLPTSDQTSGDRRGDVRLSHRGGGHGGPPLRRAAIEGKGGIVAVPVDDSASPEEDLGETVGEYRSDRQALEKALAVLDYCRLEAPDAELTAALTGVSLLRVWARWLRQFSGSSVPYLLDSFIRRAGRLLADDDVLVVELDPGPIDVVLEMAGYLGELERVPLLDDRRIEFRKRRKP